MMVVDAVGKKYGRLTVLERAGSNKKKNAVWLCRCDCGNLTKVTGTKLRNGHTQSCGCLNREMLGERNTRHGGRREPLYVIWKNMRGRCSNKNTPVYKNYGGRGITVCEEWCDYSKFREWAIDSGYESGLELDRRDNDGGYSPTNCRWVSRKANNNNKRTNIVISYGNESRTATEWAEVLGMKVETILWRYHNWGDVERVLFAPVRRW